MKKSVALLTMLFTLILVAASAKGPFRQDSINKVIPTENDIPGGFMIGKIPSGAKEVFKGNPWLMDSTSIRKLTGKIYPGGDYSRVLNIHMTILASQKKPFSDDIVCYVILYRDATGAKEEIRKLSEYAGYNRDRAIVIPKDNMAVFLHVDDVNDFHHIRAMADKMEVKMKEI